MPLNPSKYPAFGLDFGTFHIKVVDLVHGKDSSALRGLAAVPIPKPETDILNQDKAELVNNLKEAVRSAKPDSVKSHFVVSALPESKVFSQVLVMPKMEKEELNTAISFEASKSMPLPKDESYMDYSIMKERKDGKLEILVVGTEKNLVEFYRALITAAGFELLVLETKPLAALRALLTPEEKLTVILADIGAKHSSITLCDEGEFQSSITHDSGSEKFIEALSKNLGKDRTKVLENLTKMQKENLKEDEILRVLYPLFEEIKAKIAESISFWGEKKEKPLEVKKLILAGGGAVVPGLIDYLAKDLGIETVLGNPLINLESSSVEKIDRNRIMSFTTAIGLALRRINEI